MNLPPIVEDYVRATRMAREARTQAARTRARKRARLIWGVMRAATQREAIRTLASLGISPLPL